MDFIISNILRPLKMTFPARLLTPTTWRTLGLTLSASIFALGSWSIISPLSAADGLGVSPTTSDGRLSVSKSMAFLGARDLCIASSLFWLDYIESRRGMGVILTNFLIVCVADVIIASQGPRGWDSGVWGLCAGSGVVAFVGLGLLGCKE